MGCYFLAGRARPEPSLMLTTTLDFCHVKGLPRKARIFS
ncbi:hypothetical protein ZYGNAAKF_CDS0172 [Enterococcus phage VRE9_2]